MLFVVVCRLSCVVCCAVWVGCYLLRVCLVSDVCFLIASCCWLGFGGRVFVVGCWLLVVSCWLCVVSCRVLCVLYIMCCMFFVGIAC